MVKPPTFDSNGMKRGAWSKEEDDRLRAFVMEYGHNNWRLLPFLAGLARCGKSCRLRWVNYLKPGLKREKFTKQEEDLIIKMHNKLGNKWSAIAAKFPGRTDNEIKNYWHAHIKKRGQRRGNNMNIIITAEIPHEAADHVSSPSPSSSSSGTSTTDDQNQEDFPAKYIDTLSPITDLHTFARAQEDLSISDQTCFFSQNINSDLPPFPFEEFHDFELLFQEMHKDLSGNSSDGGSSLCSSNTAEFMQENLWSNSFGEEDILNMELW